jgi:hypothetical protein
MLNNDDARKICIEARGLIAQQEHWTIGALARTKEGSSCYPEDLGAQSFCARGALLRSLKNLGYAEYTFDTPTETKIAEIFCSHLSTKYRSAMGIAYWNNDSNHKTVLEGFDTVIAAL